MGKTHLIIGICSGFAVAVVSHLPPEHGAFMALAAAAGALLPDMVHPKGMIRRKLGILGYPLNILPHRGPTHSLLAVVLVVLLYLATHLLVAFGLFIGYVSHLMADMITVEGIPLFFPLSRAYISLLPIRTGGIVERMIALGVTLGAVYFVYLLLT